MRRLQDRPSGCLKSRLAKHVFLWLLIILVPTAGFAQARNSELQQLIAEALRNNPEIHAAQKRYEASRQRPTQASSLPDPMFSAGYNSSGSPRPLAGLGREPTSNMGFMLTQEFPFPGKRKLEGDMAAREADAEFQQYQTVQLSVVSRVKQAYYNLSYACSASEVFGRNLNLLRQLLRITEARYSVGQAAQQDVFKTQTEVSILEARLLQLRREQQAREAELTSLLNRSPGTSFQRPIEVQPIGFSTTLDELFAFARSNTPMLRRDQKMVERAEVAMNLARKQYYPDYALTAGYFNMGAMPDMYMFRADFKVPVYFFRKQRAAVTEQAQTLAESRRNYEATNQTLHFRIKDDFLMATVSKQLLNLYSRTVVPQASLALESSLTSYQTGGVDLLSVLTNYATVLEYELNYHEELRNFFGALSRLEEMTGMPLIQ